MTIKTSKSITITVLRTTVRKLRAMKGSDTWDQLLLRLSGRGRCGIECMVCGYWLETDDTGISLDGLAERHGWTGIYSEEVIVEGKGIGSRMKIGYRCRKCAEDKRKILQIGA